MNHSDKQSKAAFLRQKAETLMETSSSESETPLSKIKMLKLIHELEVHQIELELINEELSRTKEQSTIVAQKYTELYDFAPSGYYTLSREGVILELNLIGANMLGKVRSQFKNNRWSSFVSEDSKPTFNLFLDNVFNHKIKESCEVSLSINDNIPMYVFLTGIVIENGDRCFITAIDITDRKQIEHELIKAKEKAEESDRLKSAFLANMSHEIRTPMNGILGFTDLLKESQFSGEDTQEYLSIIERSGNRMLNILNDIICISKVESGQMEVSISETNVNEQIEYIYKFFKPEVERKGMQFSFYSSLATKEAVIRTDREKTYAILTNLVKNAIKYSDKGAIEIGVRLKYNYLEFYVTDNGIGIPYDKSEIIFNRFIQADIADSRAYQGAGLGLSIAKAYVEMLGGKIWVESDEGNGSTFFFTLPYNTDYEPEMIIQNIISTETEKNKFEKIKILIVEDDETSTLFLKEIVNTLSDNILLARTGTEAIETCQSNPDINLILMDIKIPEMNGYEVTRQIRQVNKEVVIIAQTAFGLSDDKEKAIAAGCNDYISKPINQVLMRKMIYKYFQK